jgi:hypothetical protein
MRFAVDGEKKNCSMPLNIFCFLEVGICSLVTFRTNKEEEYSSLETKVALIKHTFM